MRIMVIGVGKFAINCIKIIQKTSNTKLILVITQPDNEGLGMSLANYCKKNNIQVLETTNINSKEILQTALEANPDIAFSLNNFSIIKKPLLETAKQGFINFHNGPLPNYGGVNVCSWAIINGESEYGVTWHYMEESIDTGDIIAQQTFPVAATETARSLTMKCINHGISLFDQLFPKVIKKQEQRQAQSFKSRSYYGLKDIPNNGKIDLSWPFKRIDNFIRGLNFHPYPNDFVYPFLSYNDKKSYILSINRIAERPLGSQIGEIISVNKDSVCIISAECIIGLVAVLNGNLELLNVNQFTQHYDLQIGGRFK